MASLIFFFISSILCFRSVSENPFTCNIRICLTIVDFPDSPAPSSSSRCVARYTCLSFCNCLLIWSLRRFWLFVSSEPLASDCFDPAEPKQPIAVHEAHQQVAPPSCGVSGDSAPLVSPLWASLKLVVYVYKRAVFLAVLFPLITFPKWNGNVCAFIVLCMCVLTRKDFAFLKKIKIVTGWNGCQNIW